MDKGDVMRIAFVWDWEPNFEQTIQLNDGLQAALRVLETRGHTVNRYTDTRAAVGDYHPIDDIIRYKEKFDVILHWADFTRPHAKPHQELGIPMAICFAGGEAVNYNTPYFDHIFVESEVYKAKLESAGYENVSIAFGTNTELFKPIEQPKLLDTIFPGTFAEWKRHQLYAQAVQGLRSLAVGYIYTDHETECWEDCLKHGVAILPHVSAETLHRLYASSRVCVIPSRSSGGSQRTVLEAMAMNLPLVVTDSDKFDYVWDSDEVLQVPPHPDAIREAVDFYINNNITVNTRDVVVEKWSEFTYADALEEGLKSIL
jgi:glycosyltransferase involved in cell wall biosynthesis